MECGVPTFIQIEGAEGEKSLEWEGTLDSSESKSYIPSWVVVIHKDRAGIFDADILIKAMWVKHHVILTRRDTGERIGRFAIQKVNGNCIPKPSPEKGEDSCTIYLVKKED